MRGFSLVALLSTAYALKPSTPLSRTIVLRGALLSSSVQLFQGPSSAFDLPPLEEFDNPRARASFASRPNPNLGKQVGSAFYAVTAGDVQTLQAMVDAGWDLDRATDTAGKTTLHRAAQLGNEAAVQILVDAGVKIDPVTKWAETPLHMAVRNNKLGAVKKLVSAGASLTKVNFNDDNALGIARRYRYEAMADFLAELGR
eukprot:CAMPEP_0119373564 /NCGR_PEP_ID=MMETSP1334-20130426/25986_1 /TAXON_ID=127549 /ORGANISM="Calcidiscus leptoporus, Strain RCC1130" /LENGTH=199 /DNA_ID=CAMNT_0007391373 /DNA_START=12 /DNA_END=611 /DNA_ORIENTATION=-